MLGLSGKNPSSLFLHSFFLCTYEFLSSSSPSSCFIIFFYKFFSIFLAPFVFPAIFSGLESVRFDLKWEGQEASTEDNQEAN